MNVEEGTSYFFNARTGESSEEHPNMRQVRATERKQRALAEAQLTERLERLREYEGELGAAEEAQAEAYGGRASRVLAEAAANLWSKRAYEARWVMR